MTAKNVALLSDKKAERTRLGRYPDRSVSDPRNAALGS